MRHWVMAPILMHLATFGTKCPEGAKDSVNYGVASWATWPLGHAPSSFWPLGPHWLASGPCLLQASWATFVGLWAMQVIGTSDFSMD